MIGRDHQAMSHTERAMLPQLELGDAYQAESGNREAVGHSEESLPILQTIQSRLELEQNLTAHGRYYCGPIRGAEWYCFNLPRNIHLSSVDY